jgi:hypothetical protein
MKSEQEWTAHGRFVQALQHEHLTCAKPGCGGPMDVSDHTPHDARIKTYEATCKRCQTKEQIAGKEEPTVGRRFDYHDGRSAPSARPTHMPI